MKKYALLFVLALSGFSPQAHAERVAIQLDQNYMGNDRVLLRQELARAGYRSEEYLLRSVTVVAEGRGMIDLVVGNEVVDSRRLQIDGDRVPNGHRVTLFTRSDFNQNRGVWQLHFGPNAHMMIRRIVVDMDFVGDYPGQPAPPPRWPIPPPNRPAPPPRWPSENVYNVRLESFGGGFLNTRWEAPRGERIVGMRLIRQHSNDACIQGQTYFASTYEATVAGGCRGTFEIVTVREYY